MQSTVNVDVTGLSSSLQVFNHSYAENGRVNINCTINTSSDYQASTIGYIRDHKPSSNIALPAIIRNGNTNITFALYVHVDANGVITLPSIGGHFSGAVICGNYLV